MLESTFYIARHSPEKRGYIARHSPDLDFFVSISREIPLNFKKFARHSPDLGPISRVIPPIGWIYRAGFPLLAYDIAQDSPEEVATPRLANHGTQQNPCGCLIRASFPLPKDGKLGGMARDIPLFPTVLLMAVEAPT